MSAAQQCCRAHPSPTPLVPFLNQDGFELQRVIAWYLLNQTPTIVQIHTLQNTPLKPMSGFACSATVFDVIFNRRFFLSLHSRNDRELIAATSAHLPALEGRKPASGTITEEWPYEKDFATTACSHTSVS